MKPRKKLKISDMEMSTELPCYEESKEVKELKEYIRMLEGMLKDQQAGLDLMKAHVRCLKSRLQL